jgi:hypothetical protein
VEERKSKPTTGVDSLSEFHEDTLKVIGQILFGTKLNRDEEPETGIENQHHYLGKQGGQLSEQPAFAAL